MKLNKRSIEAINSLALVLLCAIFILAAAYGLSLGMFVLFGDIVGIISVIVIFLFLVWLATFMLKRYLDGHN